jgi:ABC-type antimicrobial peptide transport system permease subunit
VSGYRFFLADLDGKDESGAIAMEEKFSDEGLDLSRTEALLTELLAVQNTYLSTFQSLGGLGLLLGTLGLAAVQVRNVVQRRRELALLRATGFRNQQLSALILHEHGLLLFGGLLVGTVAALVVVLPHILFGGASIPVWSLLTTLAMVVVVGIISGWFAQRSLQGASLISALRDE